MAEYMVESPHTEKECLAVMDEMAEKGSKSLNKFDWGCMKGEHTAWAKVKAKNESEAKKIVPEMVRKKARVVEISKVNAKDIKKFHEHM